MTRREFLAGALALKAPARRPNVLVVMADDQRADYLGCTGHPVVKTPNIDALARRGTLFTQAYATSAACTPSRACFFLGQWERKHGINFNSASSLQPRAFDSSYPMLLKRAGYFVGYIGKNHVPVGAGGYKSGYLEKAFDYWYANHGHTTFYPKRLFEIYRNARADTQPEILQEGASNFLEPNDAFLAGAREFLRRRPPDRPFCLTVAFNVPHSAGTGSMQLLPSDPELYRTAYRDQVSRLLPPKTYLAEKDIKEPKIPREVYSGKYIASYDYVKTPEGLRERQIRWCQTITGIDNLVGALLGQLQALGLAENTIVIYSSDHGIQHGEHGLGGKVLLYEESIRIPLIIYDPRIPKPAGRVEHFALSVDVAPTILSLCGLETPPVMQGRSLERLMRGRRVRWRQDFFCENLFTGQDYPRLEAVRGRDWKYIRYFRRSPEGSQAPYPYAGTLVASIQGEKPVYEELYHLAQDPYEERNLASDPVHRGKLEELRRRCQHLVTEAKGPPGWPMTIPD